MPGPHGPQCTCIRDISRLAVLLALRAEAIDRSDADLLIEIDAEFWAMGIPPPANDNHRDGEQ